jgi:hypothetical protein
VDAAVEAAASQLVEKALRFISLNDTPEASPRPSPARAASATKPLFRFDSTFLDKGLDAINGVGKMMEGLAVTLDSVIGQAFDEWGTPSKDGTPAGARGRSPASVAAQQRQRRARREAEEQQREKIAAAPADGWGDFDVADTETKQGAAGRPSVRSTRAGAPEPTQLGASVCAGQRTLLMGCDLFPPATWH